MAARIATETLEVRTICVIRRRTSSPPPWRTPSLAHNPVALPEPHAAMSSLTMLSLSASPASRLLRMPLTERDIPFDESAVRERVSRKEPKEPSLKPPSRKPASSAAAGASSAIKLARMLLMLLTECISGKPLWKEPSAEPLELACARARVMRMLSSSAGTASEPLKPLLDFCSGAPAPSELSSPPLDRTRRIGGLGCPERCVAWRLSSSVPAAAAVGNCSELES
mmetsp:Transcript_6768/g.16528  ORF Transcript_6768/g.16528 Transcript_6768/m.16528 type:complete len:225 (-) Transcript_6768:755-1429(-)